MPAPLHINIADPCHENWQQMTPNEQGRHCGSCQKTVVDFTLMSDQEILHYISRASSSVCGRFYNHQLDKIYEEKKVKSAFTFRYAWNLLVATFLLTGSAASAQVKKKAKKKTAVKKEWAYKHTLKNMELSSSDFKIMSGQDATYQRTLGFVVTTEPQDYIDQQGSRLIEPPLKMFGFIRDNNTGKPIDAATVRLKGVKAGVEAGEDGRFEFPIVDISGKVILEVTAKGYETKEYLVDVNSFRSMDFGLESDGSIVYDAERSRGMTLGKVAVQPTKGKVAIKDTTLVETKIEASVCETITMGTPVVRIVDEENDDTQQLIGYIINGQIIDDKTGKPVSFASVRIKGQKAGVAADEAGSFSIAMPAKKAAMALVISSVGYANKEIDVTENERRSYQIRLSPAADNLKPVEVVLLSSISCGRGAPHPFIKKDELPVSIDSALQGTVGRVIVTQDVTVVEKTKQEVKEWLPTLKDVRIYPNPVMPGNTVNISLNLDKAGEYKLELMDASGRVVHIQALQIAQKAQVVNVPTQSSWSHGIYLIRISNATDRNVYQAKLLLQ